MRKLVIEFTPGEIIRKVQGPMFEDISSYEVLEVLRISYEEGVKIGLVVCTAREDISINDARLPDHIQILNVLTSEGNRHTCMVRMQDPELFDFKRGVLKLDLIWTTPIIYSDDKFTFSCIGSQEDILKYIEIVKSHSEIDNMSFQKAVYKEHDILTVLTDKQRDILVAAHKYGYYDSPKKITSEQLSQKFSISKSTFLQHLRKAEKRLLVNIMAGHPLKR